MKKIIITSLVLILSSSNIFSQDWGVSWTPPFLPFSLVYGSDGWSIKAEHSINTPVGKLGIEVSGNVSQKDENTVKVIERQVPGPVRIQYVYRDNPNPKTLIQVKTVTRIIEKKSYIIELKNYKGTLSQEFIIQGLDVFEISAEGLTKIEAREGRVIIDLSESSVKEIRFKGGVLTPENSDDLILKLCTKYNTNSLNLYIDKAQSPNKILGFVNYEQFQKKPSTLTLPTSALHINYRAYPSYGGQICDVKDERFVKEIRNIFDYSNEVVNFYKLSDPSLDLLSFYRQIAVTNKGIGIVTTGSQYPVQGKYKNSLLDRVIKRKPKYYYKTNIISSKKGGQIFFTWADFLNQSFDVVDDNTIRIGGRYKIDATVTFDVQDSCERTSKTGFNATQFTRFLKELQEIVGKNLVQ